MSVYTDKFTTNKWRQNIVMFTYTYIHNKPILGIIIIVPLIYLVYKKYNWRSYM